MNVSSCTTLIVTYNSAKDILQLLADLSVHAPAHKIVLIDNASTDETVQLVQERFPHLRLVRNGVNVGYARAVNQGVALCTTEYVLLLNPDIRISSPSLFVAMEECLRHSRLDAVAAPLQFKMTGRKRKLNLTWSYTTPGSFGIYLSFLLRGKTNMDQPVPVTFLNAGCLFMRRAAFNQVGKFNEKYFLYGEEPDLCLKFKRYGFQCYLLPDVYVVHLRERSLRTVPFLQRLRIRFQAVRNIIDALITGWAYILRDKLVVSGSKQLIKK